ncbi:MAG: DUF2480 family protein [Bacteroidota bacterium]
MDSKPLVNKVKANTKLITLNLEDFFPTEELVVFDLKDYLFMELILKEKDFRKALKELDWSQYADKHLLITCSTDAIIPIWAYMLVTVYAAPIAKSVFQGTEAEFFKNAFATALNQLDVSPYENKFVVIKGCSEKTVPLSAYVDLTRLLQPVARSIMFGEPCSTVPLYKRPKTRE